MDINVDSEALSLRRALGIFAVWSVMVLSQLMLMSIQGASTGQLK